MFGKTSIRAHVLKAVEEMIVKVQAVYDEEINRISREAEQQKLVAKEKAIESIVGKFR